MTGIIPSLTKAFYKFHGELDATTNPKGMGFFVIEESIDSHNFVVIIEVIILL